MILKFLGKILRRILYYTAIAIAIPVGIFLILRLLFSDHFLGFLHNHPTIIIGVFGALTLYCAVRVIIWYARSVWENWDSSSSSSEEPMVQEHRQGGKNWLGLTPGVTKTYRVEELVNGRWSVLSRGCSSMGQAMWGVDRAKGKVRVIELHDGKDFGVAWSG